jgi:two-component system NtrC family sensor kinase
MKVGADRIRDIVLTLRNFSRLDEADVKKVDIHQGLESTLLILQNRLNIPTNPLGIEVIKKYGKIPLVECYPGQLNQVYINLLANAIDAIESQVKIENKPTIVIETEMHNKEQVKIKIRDNGIGMTEEVRKRLFDPFFTTKPIGKGTGLGLAISHAIVVDKHGGKLVCDSSPGEGAVFTITIPISQNEKSRIVN